MRDSIKHCQQRRRADFKTRLMDRRKRRLQKLGVLHVVHSSNADLGRNLHSDAIQGRQQLRRCIVICADDGVRLVAIQKFADRIHLARLNPLRQVRSRNAQMSMERSPVAIHTRINCVRREGPREERNPARARK